MAFTISQAGSYRLAANLQSVLGDCIVVLADNVSIGLAATSNLSCIVEGNVDGSR